MSQIMTVGFNAKGATTKFDRDFPLTTGTRILRPFRPTEFFVQQLIVAVDSKGQITGASSAVASDVFLSSVYMGGDSTFPNKPAESIENGSTYLNFVLSPAILGKLRWAHPPEGEITYTVLISAQLCGETTT